MKYKYEENFDKENKNAWFKTNKNAAGKGTCSGST